MNKIRNYLPHFVVFFSSMSIMIMELVASRIISKYFGSSLFTWTGVIGIVLGGISAGNFIGGRLADKHEPRRLAPFLLFTASVLVFGILGLDALLGIGMNWTGDEGITLFLVIQSVLVTVLLFFLPSAALGTISPTMAKYALQYTNAVGSTVGSIYGVSAAGSIIGTFMAGYVLIPLIGVRTIIFLVGGVLASLALFVGANRRFALTWMACILGSYLLLTVTPQAPAGSESERILYEKDSHYMHIVVKDRTDARLLIMDGLIHNMHDPQNPDRLLYEYERVFLSLTREFAAANPGRALRTLTLGGGAMTFPSFLSRNFPTWHTEVVEIDPEVVRTGFKYFNVPRSDNLEVHVIDARMIPHVVPGRRYDIIYLDAFNSFSVPYHLTTVEYLKTIRSLLSPGGVVLVNAIDILKFGRFVSAYHATLAAAFPHVSVYVDTGFDPSRRTTFVLTAADRAFGAVEARDDTGAVIARVLDPGLIAEAAARTGARVLTDDHAPVEILMAPVFLDTIN